MNQMTQTQKAGELSNTTATQAWVKPKFECVALNAALTGITAGNDAVMVLGS